MDFRPFDDGASSIGIDEMTVEDTGDTVAIYGSLTIELTKEGLARAEKMAEILNATVARMKEIDLPEDLPPSNVSTRPNPF